MEVQRLKKAIQTATPEDAPKLQRQLDEWTSISAEIEQRFPEIFGQLLEAISGDSDPEEQVGKLIRGYEANEEEARQLLREVCELCLS
jgi:hypothetical protein